MCLKNDQVKDFPFTFVSLNSFAEFKHYKPIQNNVLERLYLPLYRGSFYLKEFIIFMEFTTNISKTLPIRGSL